VITGAQIEGIGNGLFWWEPPKNSTSGDRTRHLIAGSDRETGEEFAPHNMQIADIDQDLGLYAVSFTEPDGYAHVHWFENISEHSKEHGRTNAFN